ncbi:hypothetical protein BCR33DRAFT_716556 [Rhizoclosmatium globosum]|uniref:Protein YOP1 n=1 Tax=Rhizoclosmatium globosum TaxID=329046 RepID=A0A1Y2CDX7_9FUNG|nr:hypothetical protein BCR33DRAFT_716556 [Rhizoclosmatium globosum]|eukprot:ORY45268.1 hypothetical protein BCR33DRAFT_716556 [Rhizoclosmatium globosum]
MTHHIQQYHHHIDFLLSQSPFLCRIEASTRIPKTRIAAAVILITILSLSLHILHLPLSHILTVALPSRLFMQYAETSNAHGIRALGLYFLILKVVNSFQNLMYDWILDYLPLFFLVKVGVCWWMFLPTSMGIEVVFNRIWPYYLMFRGVIDDQDNNQT